MPNPKQPPAAQLQLDPYDVVRLLRQQGHTFATIARDVRMWFDDDPGKKTLTGAQLKEWYEAQAGLRR